jgi:D-glycero-D-manno-heptose 1,7-bisphosphate phosphatase
MASQGPGEPMSGHEGRRAVFLDRDGTLIEEVDYLDRLDRLALYPWSVDAVRILNQAGFAVVVVSNQSGVARGLFDEAFVAETHAQLNGRMAAGGARIDRFYYCPHHPQGIDPRYREVCGCRKPAPGMIRRAAEELGIDPRRAFVVGDRWLDVQLGQAVGATRVLVRTGYGRREERRPQEGVTAAAVVDTLIDAVSWILGSGLKPGENARSDPGGGAGSDRMGHSQT